MGKMARCPKCEENLLLCEENFHPRKDSKSGFRKTCRKCMSIQWSEYRQANLEVIRERDKKQDLKRYDFKKEYRYQRYWENRELEAQKNKENHLKHRDKRIAYFKNRYRENPDKYKETEGRYRKTEAYRVSINKSRQKRRAIKRRLMHDFTKGQWIACKEYFGNVCAYCGNESIMSHDLDQEHFIASDNGGPYTVTNIIPSCRSCNSQKHTSDFFEWYPRHSTYSPEREQKILAYLNLANRPITQQLLFAI